MCALTPRTSWRHGDRCISCADKDKYAVEAVVVPRWVPVADEECRMCDHVQAPNIPAPTPAPTVPPSAYGAGSTWDNTWVSADKNVHIGWKFGGALDTDTDASNALTFRLSCPGCAADGWVAIGINPATANRTHAQMEGTSAIIWKLGDNSVREYEIAEKKVATIIPWGSRMHIDRIATDAGGKHATFSIGAGPNPGYEWHIGSSTIDNFQEITTMTYAYALEGGFVFHNGRGVVPMKLRPPAHDPLAAAAADDADGWSSDSGKEKAALGATLAILGGIGVNILLVAVIAATVVIVVLVLKRARTEHHLELEQRLASGARIGKAFDGKPSPPPLPQRVGVQLLPLGSAQPSASRASVEDSDFYLDLDADSSKRDSVNSDLDINLDEVHSASERPLSGFAPRNLRPLSGFASDSPLSAKNVVQAEARSQLDAVDETYAL